MTTGTLNLWFMIYDFIVCTSDYIKCKFRYYTHDISTLASKIQIFVCDSMYFLLWAMLITFKYLDIRSQYRFIWVYRYIYKKIFSFHLSQSVHKFHGMGWVYIILIVLIFMKNVHDFVCVDLMWLELICRRARARACEYVCVCVC